MRSLDLEAAGIRIIQIDEPAFREGLPLRRTATGPNICAGPSMPSAWPAPACATRRRFTRTCATPSSTKSSDAIAGMDADVISIESARSQMELLERLRGSQLSKRHRPWHLRYPLAARSFERGDGCADRKSAAGNRAERLWVNPDCGLKTRTWEQVTPALENMVAAAKTIRRARPSH